MRYKQLIDRFIKYTKYETTSDNKSKASPSTPGQLELAKVVFQDLKDAGIKDVELTNDGFIYATIPSNVPASKKVPTIGLLSHLDTALEVSGKNVKARFIENYQGGDITYPNNPDLKLTSTISPNLKKCIGHTLITSDGTTLLSVDDKAGISILVELAKRLTNDSSIPHGKIRIGIIPDEEIGVGTEKLDLKKFGADVAYTLDGGELGELDVESFNGFKGTIKVTGCSAFPGYGKDIYLSAIQVLGRFISEMNTKRWPQNASGRDVIWWLDDIKGSVANAEASIYLRNFDLEEIEEQKEELEKIKQKVLREFPKAKIEIDIKETYRNYRYLLEKDPRIVAYAEEAMKRLDIKPHRNILRGGNDSCHLCVMGLLSTNIFIGMQNMHSLMEWTSIDWIEKSLDTVVELVQVWIANADTADKKYK